MLPCMAVSQRGSTNRVQAYLKVHGGWQLEAVSIVHLQWKGDCLQSGHLSLILIIITSRLDGLLLEYFH